MTALTFEELLAEYRANGGIAENVRLGEGTFGRGIFPIDPAKPLRLLTPPSLLVPRDAIEIREGHLRTRPGIVSEAAATFFERYQDYFGWSAGGRDESWQSQAAWHGLPPDIRACITKMGIAHPEVVFAAPSDEMILHDYFSRRQFSYEGKLHVVPMIDLVNYAPTVPGYVTEGGFGVAGTFDGEAFVLYNLHDAIDLLLNYNFTARANFAYSVAITVDLPGGMQLSIGRTLDQNETIDGVGYPKTEQHDNRFALSYLKLGNRAAPGIPRGAFRRLMRDRLDAPSADSIFDSIARFNRDSFIELVRVAGAHDEPLPKMLVQAALNQLEALSACVGAKPL